MFEEHLSLGLLAPVLTASEWAEQMSMGWLRLDSDIRSRIADAGLPWLPTRAYLQLKDGVQKAETLARGALQSGRRDNTIDRLVAAGSTIVPGREKTVLLGEASTTDEYLEQVRILLVLLRDVRSLAS